MALVFRWLLRIASALFVLIVAAFALSYYFASRSLVDYDADETVAGLSAPVEIVRDNAAVPHIFGDTDEDVFFGLGYAHAQDRMWQMTMLRRTAQGRLSELFGPRTLPTDRLLRRLDLYNTAIASVAAQDDATKAALDAYSAGVNAWLGKVNEGARGRGAPEMWLFNQSIAPWQPADSLAILKVMALQLTSHVEQEVLRARVSLRIGSEPAIPDERLHDILPEDPGTGVAALPEFAALFPDAPTDTGGVIGGTIPGVPVILTGRSVDLGWGITSSNLDDQDIFLEELNPEDSTQYRTPDGWATFRSRDSIITVKDSGSETIKLRWSENGPVLSRDMFDLRHVLPEGHVATLGWTALSREDTSLSSAMALMRARTIEDGIAAGEGFIAPSQNLILADRNRIAMKTIGAMPARDPDHQSQGRLPAPGWRVENRWQGILPYDTNPEFLEPEGGILGNTNNKMIDRPFPEHVSFTWGDTQRINRWRGLMQAREVHTLGSFVEAQLDTVSFTARALLPLIGADLWYTGDPSPDDTPERRRQQALELLAAWNGEMNEHLPEPLIYAAWLRALQDRLTRDELGPLTAEFTHPDPVFIERVFRDVDGASAWCDVLQSAQVETCTDISRQALDDALIWINETYGTTIASLRWGDAHQATHDHQVLGEVPVLNWFVNIRQSTSGGDNTLERGRTSGVGRNPFQNVHAAGYRGVYDFADPDSSVFITATGQSGHPLSRHYEDLGELWRRGEYIPMSLDPALARAAQLGTIVLTPETASR
ncbi:MAG: penicillin acylase family protein [Loktanella sp.]|nr:penicillin acylase family protein [Loktanella sp.]